MSERPYTLLSCAVSVDGYLDDAGGERLVLSNQADLDRVDEVRASCDAILVGAGTIRRDDPRLLVRSPARRQARLDRGLPESPAKVTLTGSGDLDPSAGFFTAGGAEKLVYCASPAVQEACERLAGFATVVDAGDPLDLGAVLADLAGRGVRRLMVEGGASVLNQFLTAGLADELHLVVAPLFVGDPLAPRFAGAGDFPHGPADRMRLDEVRRIGDVALLRYLLDPRRPEPPDRRWLREAIELSRRCPPSDTAFSVGAVVVDADGRVMATGYSREDGPHDHAEEVALRKLAAGLAPARLDAPLRPDTRARLEGATIYSSLEPCGARASRSRTCAELILKAGIRRVVFAWREPSVFVEGRGAEILREAGVEVVEVPCLADRAREVNAHLLG